MLLPAFFPVVDGRQRSFRLYRAHVENQTVILALQCLIHAQRTFEASHARARTLSATDSKEIPRLLPHSALSPLRLWTVTILASFHCCGTQPEDQALVMKRWSRCKR